MRSSCCSVNLSAKKLKINRLELKWGSFKLWNPFFPADIRGCGLLCVGPVGQLAPVNQWSCDCAGLCGFLMNVSVDTEHLATLKLVWLRPHPSSTCARGRTSAWNCCLSKSEVWLPEPTYQKRDEGRFTAWSVCECVCEDVASVWVGTVPLCNPCLFSLCYLPSVQNDWANKQPTYWGAAAWNMHAVFMREREKQGEKGERAK